MTVSSPKLLPYIGLLLFPFGFFKCLPFRVFVGLLFLHSAMLLIMTCPFMWQGSFLWSMKLDICQFSHFSISFSLWTLSFSVYYSVDGRTTERVRYSTSTPQPGLTGRAVFRPEVTKSGKHDGICLYLARILGSVEWVLCNLGNFRVVFCLCLGQSLSYEKLVLFQLHMNKSDCHLEGFALGLALKQRRKVTPKWSIHFTLSCAASSVSRHVTPISFSSDSTVLGHVVLSVRRFLLSVAVHLRPTLGIWPWGILVHVLTSQACVTLF